MIKNEDKCYIVNKLLETGEIVNIHLATGVDRVVIPNYLKANANIMLQVGLNTAKPVVDLEVDDEGISCTLSFNGSPEWCSLPWDCVSFLNGDAVDVIAGDGSSNSAIIFNSSLLPEPKGEPKGDAKVEKVEKKPEQKKTGTKRKLPPYLRVIK